MNYYGYNGESANVKTGFQYLRERYYYAENGAFTTEDSDLGTKENPLTRNRYSYVMNNPLNYADPTGHRAKAASGMGCAGAVVKSIGNIAKTVTNVVKAAAGVAMAVGSIHAQAAQTGGTKGQTRGIYQSGYVPSGRSTGGLSYIQYMSKIVMQQMKVVLCTNQRQKVSGASVASGVAMPFWLAGLIEAAPVAGLVVVGVGGVLLVGYLLIKDSQEEQEEKESGKNEERLQSGDCNKGTFDSAEESLDYHYRKHGKEVGAKNKEQYLRKAKEFARTAKKGSTKKEIDGEVEGVVRYKKGWKIY